MVTQPAYIANLKAYARARFGEPNQSDHFVDDMVADLSNESDRGAIILAATSVEDTLERAILGRMPVLFQDETARKRVFENEGIVGTFSKKLEIAYALGLIDAETRKQIDLIREIRNCCAHARKPLSMDKDVLLNA
jgi:DNA-binding MltR family transcriptional regulator